MRNALCNLYERQKRHHHHHAYILDEPVASGSATTAEARVQYIEAWGRGIPLILEKAPNVRFSQAAGIFITEFPRPSASEDVESGLESRPESRPESNLAVMIIESLASAPLGKIEIARAIGHQTVSGELKKQILWLLEHNLIERTIPDKPNSRLQKYRLTPKGHSALK